ncbi:hypothetical protein [Metabacillus litoralis]|uniref:hypothetical protein n=1 Tax=Metabacillus litoralis TaxID=152268 RepID=UPI00203F26EB|nr:hypothetical protein [Metabacillus litoralis]
MQLIRYVHRYRECRDKSKWERANFLDNVGIEARARGEGGSCIDTVRIGQERVEKKRVCLDTVRIGTNKSRKEGSVSRYYENRDKQEQERCGCVSIP